MTRLTKEEHIARAMLMGMIYDPNDHTYSDLNSTGEPAFFGENLSDMYALDADTLEKIMYEDCKARDGLKQHDP